MKNSSLDNTIGTILLRNHRIDSATLDHAVEECRVTGKQLEEYLVEKNIVNDIDITLATSEYLSMAPITLAHFTPDIKLLELIPKEILMKNILLPIALNDKVLTVALGDPYNTGVIDEIQTLTGLTVVPVIAPEREIKDLLQKFSEQISPDLEDIFKGLEEDATEVEVNPKKAQEEMSLDKMLESAEGAPVIRIVNSILVEAMRKGASDIHVEPMEKILRLRYRVDGDLYEAMNPPKNLQSAIVSRIKLMSDMNIAERRIPQDGRIKVKALGKEIDIRVSVLPIRYGEKVVMRILDKTTLASSIADLGLDQKAYDSVLYAICHTHGIILVTGPTGSGKTTTLYSCLQELNKVNVNVVTTEDPVEYELQGINQVQINENVGLTFAHTLRSILRQDPDIVMVGEIRDLETAAIAVQAALTGHLVLSTLHTNDAAGAITRLRDMGIQAFLLASSLIMTQAQRLYKKLCPACKQPARVSEEVLKFNNIDQKYFKNAKLYKAVGCPRCGGIGFKGRAALMEILIVNDKIREMILQNATANTLTKQAVSDGMMTLKMVGLTKVKQGITSLTEMLRVTGGE